ncbi:hypothetical protein CBR_g8258 [Chara braunii]|uniref:Uncharacterized protein n=1 Tax=Chara braunii TaxID=69332 RepID=A0A388KLT5_CHABU|nr:hypothetical protein CBR_g8258 [Chara braunii]|eukprot:GBG70958.1 hypothetical protein CBR_g8258 [Chara braunii]
MSQHFRTFDGRGQGEGEEAFDAQVDMKNFDIFNEKLVADAYIDEDFCKIPESKDSSEAGWCHAVLRLARHYSEPHPALRIVDGSASPDGKLMQLAVSSLMRTCHTGKDFSCGGKSWFVLVNKEAVMCTYEGWDDNLGCVVAEAVARADGHMMSTLVWLSRKRVRYRCKVVGHRRIVGSVEMATRTKYDDICRKRGEQRSNSARFNEEVDVRRARGARHMSNIKVDRAKEDVKSTTDLRQRFREEFKEKGKGGIDGMSSTPRWNMEQRREEGTTMPAASRKAKKLRLEEEKEDVIIDNPHRVQSAQRRERTTLGGEVEDVWKTNAQEQETKVHRGTERLNMTTKVSEKGN